MVFDSRLVAWAMPKSPSLTSPRRAMKTFEGEMSRWTSFMGRFSLSKALWA